MDNDYQKRLSNMRQCGKTIFNTPVFGYDFVWYNPKEKEEMDAYLEFKEKIEDRLDG